MKSLFYCYPKKRISEKAWESSKEVILFPDKASFYFSHDFPSHVLFHISFVSVSSLPSYDWSIIQMEDFFFEPKDHEMIW